MKTQLRKQTNLHKQVKQLTVCALALGTVVGAILPTMVEAKSPEQEIGEHFSSLATHVKDDSVELWLYKGFVLTAELTKGYIRQQKGLEESFEEVEDNLVSEPINISPVARVAEFVGVEESPEVLAPVIKEPVYEAPVVVEPVVDETVSEEPVYVEPVVEAPIVEESVVEDEPVNISPIIRVEDLEWSNDGSQEEPIVGTPVVEESVIEAPVVEEPVYVEPVVEAPLTGGVQMRVQATMYSQHQEGLSNWTAGGYNLNENPNIIAVNPSVIPYGSVVVIEGVGTYIAGDTGSYTTWGGDYTTGIDIHTNDLATAYEFGKKFVNITVYPAGTDVASHGRVSPVVEESTLAEEPVIEEPVIEEPVYVEPVIEEPVYVEPVVEEPAYVEPVIEESVIEEPVVEEPVYVEPVIEEPVLELPVTDEPVYVEPVIEEPVIEEPVYVEPVIEEPVYVEPVIEEPVYEEPVYEEPVYEEPVYNGGDIIANAEKYIGTPYEWGGKTPDGFDCSGFVQYVYEETYGVNLGGWTGEQQYSGSVIGVDEAQVGDLYFWGQYGGDTSHVAIAAGGGNYIHASQPGTDLGYSHTDWYTPDFAVSPNL